ncbi:MAG: DUF6714 family protein [Chitinophagales bacterium]
MPYSTPKTLIQSIKEAFADVPKGEMNLIDALKKNKNSASKKLQREVDIATHWQAIEEKILIAGIDSINYLDAPSWKYYLPAYLIWAIENQHNSNAYLLDFIIDALAEYKVKESLEKYESLTEKQGEMVYYFLWLMVNSDWQEVDTQIIEECIFQYWMKFTYPTAEQIILKIKDAFGGVRKGNKTIHEGEAMDDYRDATEEERKREKSKHWEEVKAKHLLECTCALTYLEGDSWKYYVPAYMTWALQNLSSDSNLWNAAFYAFNSELEFSVNKYKTLNKAQSETVYSFLLFMESLWENPHKAEKAIPLYWQAFKPNGSLE